MPDYRLRKQFSKAVKISRPQELPLVDVLIKVLVVFIRGSESERPHGNVLKMVSRKVVDWSSTCIDAL